MKSDFTAIDLFAGIGGLRIASEKCGGQTIAFSEINSDAINFYACNFSEKTIPNLGDITKIKQLPNHDLLTAGVPCQSWSIAGKNLGFADDRGQLWNDVLYLLKQAQPKTFIFENVKGLADPRNKAALDYIMERIKEAGYFANYYVLNSFDYGVLQNRIRIYIIGFKECRFYNAFILPKQVPSKLKLKDIIDDEVICLPTVKNKVAGVKSLLSGATSLSSNNNGFNDYFLFNDLRNGQCTIHSWDITNTTLRQKELCLFLLRHRRKKDFGPLDGNPLSLKHFQLFDKTIKESELEELISLGILKKKESARENNETLYDFRNAKISTGLFGINRIFLPSSSVFSTLVASDGNDYLTPIFIEAKTEMQYKQDFIKYVFDKKQYRKISKAEALKIQGFPVNFQLPELRSCWMKLIGNSVAVPVVESLINAIIKTGVFKGYEI